MATLKSISNLRHVNVIILREYQRNKSVLMLLVFDLADKKNDKDASRKK